MFYKKHVFFCTNQKDAPKKCCMQGNAQAMLEYTRERCKIEGLTAHNNVRVSKSGCLGRCDEGTCVVIYPQGRWYTYQTTADIDAIIEQELIDNIPVEKLLLP